MKRRIIYLVLPIVVMLTGLSPIFAHNVSAASVQPTGGGDSPTDSPSFINSAATLYCASDSNTDACVKGYTAGYTDAENGKNDAGLACASYDTVVSKTGISDNSGYTSCGNGYIEALSEEPHLNKNPSSSINNGSGGPGATAPSCESNGSGLAWMFCGIINDLSGGVDWIYNDMIQPLLVTQPLNLSNSSSDPVHTYAIWSNFRLYGDIFLVLALLIVVFGESIGGGLLDAYTVKRVLPRIMAAAILINLSIYLVAIAVDITNVIGAGINNLLQAPFNAQINGTPGHPSQYYTLQMNNVTGSIGGGVTLAVIITALFHITAAAKILMYVAAAVLIPALCLFLAIMATVVVRRGLIVLLVFLAPIAFALYCLPNTEKYFRRWWDLLMRTLMVYPLIAVFFALGNIMSVTISSSSGGFIDQSIADLVGVVAMFIPLFAIPYSFRIAGGVLGRFHDFATQGATKMHQGILGAKEDPDSMIGRLKFQSDSAREESGLTAKQVSARLRPSTAFNRQQRLDNVASIRDSRLRQMGDQYAKESLFASTNEGNDQYQLAVANRGMAETKRDKVRQDLEDARARGASASEISSLTTEESGWNSALGAARNTASSPATRMMAAQKLFASGYQISEGQKGYNEMAEIVSGITGAQLARDTDGNVTGVQTGDPNAGSYANAMNQAQYGERTAGRFELAGINNGSGYDGSGGLSKASDYILGAQAKPAAFKGAASDYLGSGGSTVNSIKADMPAQERDTLMAQGVSELQAAVANGSVDRDEVANWHARLLGSSQSATGANKHEIDKQLRLIESAAGINSSDASQPAFSPTAPLARRVWANKQAARRRPSDDDREALDGN
jgi:hypothetical protein